MYLLKMIKMKFHFFQYSNCSGRTKTKNGDTGVDWNDKCIWKIQVKKIFQFGKKQEKFTIEKHCHLSSSIPRAVIYILFPFFFVFGGRIFVSRQSSNIFKHMKSLGILEATFFPVKSNLKAVGFRWQRASSEMTDDNVFSVVNFSCKKLLL